MWIYSTLKQSCLVTGKSRGYNNTFTIHSSKDTISQKTDKAAVMFEVMTDFVHIPYKTIYVRGVIKMSSDDLLSMMATLESGNAYWADGVLFASFAMTDSEELAKKEMGGETYIDKIVFAKHNIYTKTVKSSHNLEINVLNVQKSKLYKDLISWLKAHPIWDE